ncbi:unnamed protein product [Cochlearia groenlandica]
MVTPENSKKKKTALELCEPLTTKTERSKEQETSSFTETRASRRRLSVLETPPSQKREHKRKENIRPPAFDAVEAAETPESHRRGLETTICLERVFSDLQCHFLSASKTTYNELVAMVEKKLCMDGMTQKLQLSYQWPQYMLMDDAKDAPPVSITCDQEVEVFLSVQADIAQLNLCAMILEVSPGPYEETDTLQPLGSIAAEDFVMDTSQALGEGGCIGPEDIVMGTSQPLLIEYNNKGKEKVVEEEVVPNDKLLREKDIECFRKALEISKMKTLPIGFEIGELVGVCVQRNTLPTPAEAHTNVDPERGNIEQPREDVGSPIIMQPYELNNDTIMSSPSELTERLIAEEFDPVEPIIWESPRELEPDEGNMQWSFI